MRKYVLMLLTIILVLVIGNISFGNTYEDDVKVYYKNVDIVKGDTLWCIAQQYNSENVSTIEYVSDIKDFNNMKNDKIIAGQTIIVPVYYK